MTSQQLQWMNAFYVFVLLVIAVLTRATLRRIAGALGGGIVVGPVTLGMIAFYEHRGWWHVPRGSVPPYLLLIGLVVSLTPFYLLTWRIARRFGRTGLGVFIAAAAILGPARDYGVGHFFPQWIQYAHGVAPVLAISVAYVVIVSLGHAVMYQIAGPSRGDQLARRPWEND